LLVVRVEVGIVIYLVRVKKCALRYVRLRRQQYGNLKHGRFVAEANQGRWNMSTPLPKLLCRIETFGGFEYEEYIE